VELKSITFTKDEQDGDVVPESAVFELTIQEIAYLATLLGQQTGITASAVMPGGDGVNSSIWNSLNGDVINRYYDDGIDDWKLAKFLTRADS
jgi:hypothetical protein